MLLFLFIFSLAHIRAHIDMNVDPKSNKSNNISLLGLSGITFTLEARADHIAYDVRAEAVVEVCNHAISQGFLNLAYSLLCASE
jgi:hypothetical protein